MKILGIITEYNPFHNGHKYHIKKSKKETDLDKTLIIMSGNFVQRGEPAIIDYYKRAEVAINNGADLVIKLPTFYSTASSDFFTYGAMKIIKEINIPTVLSFGSECENLSSIKKIAKFLSQEEDAYYRKIRDLMQSGMSMPRAREKIIMNKFPDAKEILKGSNNILAIDYIKNSLKLNIDNIDYKAIKRIGADYNDSSVQNVMSASGIRKNIFNSNICWKSSVPPETVNMIKKSSPTYVNSIYRYLNYSVLKEDTDIKKYRDVIEGLENRLVNEIDSISSYEELIDMLHTKRYTKTFLQRMILSIFLGITKEDFAYIQNRYYPFLQIIDFSKKGREIINYINDNSSIPLIHNLNKYPWKDYYTIDKTIDVYRNLELKADKIYSSI